MRSCSSCSASVADDARFCPSCGSPAPAGLSSAGTVHRDAPTPSSGSIDYGRFVPGAIFGTRYRIVALLGRGGMGEVFRADDLKLGQPVALKLLPKKLAAHEDRRQRLLGEVRIARQIAHPNVCRVYDVGEVEGEYFITMEYVPGEDLASLLQRIGRLPKDKGLEIARQICAGMAAAHERGVLHRDLKPANIMLDERGKVRITDFGLATLSSDVTANAAEGTPAYMAPEQLAGGEATARSDVYALGLVLYELFTGKRAFSASSLAEMRELREQKSLTDPSRIVDDIDPAVERAILRCLENDPRDRPASVVALAAALPGGDPLAEALAAGETPSPELLAAAGEKIGLTPSVALPLLLFVLLGSVAVLFLRQERHIVAFVDMQLEPAALTLKARETLRQLGYVDPPAHSVGDLTADRDLLRYIRENDQSADRWERLGDEQPAAVTFWYREARRPLEWRQFFGASKVTPTDPPPIEAGMKQVSVDPAGRLVHLSVVPQRTEFDAPAAPVPADWSVLFTAAGLEAAAFQRVAPRWVPPQFADERAAWEGTSAAGRPLRIEAASYRGRPVFFRMIGPWTRPDLMEERPATAASRADTALRIVLFVAIVGGGILMARRNLRLGRGDRRGATRILVFVFSLFFVMSLLHTDHTSTPYEIGILVTIASFGLFIAAIVWLLYLALEPFVRRRWPHSLIAWGKVLAGRFRDPLVGRDLLIGAAGGVAVALLEEVVTSAAILAGRLAPEPSTTLGPLSSARHSVEAILSEVWHGTWIPLVILFLVFLVRLAVRRDWAALAVVVALGVTLTALASDDPLVSGSLALIAWLLLLFVMIRFGLLASAATVGVGNLLTRTVAAPLSAWYAHTTWITLAAVAALALFAFYTALAGRPLFREALLET
jgi:predicted Ser/Thr protein kinase